MKTNQPVEVTAEDEISAGAMFEKAKSNQLIEQMQMFTHAMYGIGVNPAMALAKVFDFSSYRKMMHIGGGSGVYSIEVIKQKLREGGLDDKILVSKSLVIKWKDKLTERFEMESHITDSGYLKTHDDPFKDNTSSYIGSMDFLKQKHIIQYY